MNGVLVGLVAVLVAVVLLGVLALVAGRRSHVRRWRFGIFFESEEHHRAAGEPPPAAKGGGGSPQE